MGSTRETHTVRSELNHVETHVMEVEWGVWTPDLCAIENIDIVLAADCLYDPKGMEIVNIEGHTAMYAEAR